MKKIILVVLTIALIGIFAFRAWPSYKQNYMWVALNSGDEQGGFRPDAPWEKRWFFFRGSCEKFVQISYGDINCRRNCIPKNPGYSCKE